MAKKHFVVEWLSWLLCIRDFINSIILETYKDIRNTLPSLKLLEQRVHELVGGGGINPHLDNVVGSKRLRSGRVNCKWVNIAGEAIRTSGIFNSYDTILLRS